MSMTSKQRMLVALDGGMPDRLPVTTHFLMPHFLNTGMGGDVDLAEARRRIPPKICMIGGFDQFHFFKGCAEADTRAEVRRCFQAAGRNGAYILCPSDNFFEAEPELVKAFADEAKRCVYERTEP